MAVSAAHPAAMQVLPILIKYLRDELDWPISRAEPQGRRGRKHVMPEPDPASSMTVISKKQSD